MNEGNVLIIFSIFMAIFLVILILVVALLMSHVNSILYNLKLDMYSIARSGIISVNKNQANIGELSYDLKTFQKEFENILKANYDLDDNFCNDEKLISKIIIKDYKILKEGQRDTFTKKKTANTVLHIVLNVKIRPIILRQILEKIFTFEIHEDVNMNFVNN